MTIREPLRQRILNLTGLLLIVFLVGSIFAFACCAYNSFPHASISNAVARPELYAAQKPVSSVAIDSRWQVLPPPPAPIYLTPAAAAPLNSSNVGLIYRSNGTFAGWIGHTGSKPPNIRIEDAPQGYEPVVGGNGSRFGDISPLTGRPKTVYVNGYTRRDGTPVRSHWRSAPSSGRGRGR